MIPLARIITVNMNTYLSCKAFPRIRIKDDLVFRLGAPLAHVLPQADGYSC